MMYVLGIVLTVGFYLLTVYKDYKESIEIDFRSRKCKQLTIESRVIYDYVFDWQDVLGERTINNK